jgi:hypothetical protein
VGEKFPNCGEWHVFTDQRLGDFFQYLDILEIAVFLIFGYDVAFRNGDRVVVVVAAAAKRRCAAVEETWTAAAATTTPPLV